MIVPKEEDFKSWVNLNVAVANLKAIHIGA